MTIHVRIDRLILDGINVAPHERPRLQAALEAELARLLAAEGLTPDLRGGGARAWLPAGPLSLTAKSGAAHLGRQIAQAVYRGLGPQPAAELPGGGEPPG